jgi:2-polyprenyl-6-hydroxyphenyl methylase/3-demethylubiquinone-9 3-methyltransferase
VENIARSTIDTSEVARFSALAAQWWNPAGKFRPLHKFNPARLAYIRDAACAHFQRDRRERRPLEGLRLLDVGCGGGLVAEPMARLGAQVVGVDPSEKNISVARLHAAEGKLAIDYRTGTIEQLLADGEAPFDIVLNLEAVEHVVDPDQFLEISAKLTAPNGLLIVATINRTLRALALAKVGAEYVLRWLPRGTHDPRKFLKPVEVERALAAAGMQVTAKAGMLYNPLLDVWRVGEDLSVNYMVTAVRA